MKTIRFTQIADERFAGTPKSLEDRIVQIRGALRIVGADLEHSPVREVRFSAEGGHTTQWRIDCVASSRTATKQAMMRAVNSIRAARYS